MASVEWRKIPTVLYPQEVLDKAFRRAGKQSDLVEDPDKYHRVRKQMARMVQAASDTIAETLLKWVDQWPSLNAQSEFDQALVDAAVGADAAVDATQLERPQPSFAWAGSSLCVHHELSVDHGCSCHWADAAVG